MGDVLLEAAAVHPKCRLLVLCGHTHGGGEVWIRENLQVLTGAAQNQRPAVQRILEVG